MPQDPIDNLVDHISVPVDGELHDEQHLAALPVGRHGAVLLSMAGELAARKSKHLRRSLMCLHPAALGMWMTVLPLCCVSIVSEPPWECYGMHEDQGRKPDQLWWCGRERYEAHNACPIQAWQPRRVTTKPLLASVLDATTQQHTNARTI